EGGVHEVEHEPRAEVERLDQNRFARLEPGGVTNDDAGQRGIARVAHGITSSGARRRAVGARHARSRDRGTRAPNGALEPRTAWHGRSRRDRPAPLRAATVRRRSGAASPGPWLDPRAATSLYFSHAFWRGALYGPKGRGHGRLGRHRQATPDRGLVHASLRLPAAQPG